MGSPCDQTIQFVSICLVQPKCVDLAKVLVHWDLSAIAVGRGQDVLAATIGMEPFGWQLGPFWLVFTCVYCLHLFFPGPFWHVCFFLLPSRWRVKTAQSNISQLDIDFHFQVSRSKGFDSVGGFKQFLAVAIFSPIDIWIVAILTAPNSYTADRKMKWKPESTIYKWVCQAQTCQVSPPNWLPYHPLHLAQVSRSTKQVRSHNRLCRHL